MLPAIAAVEGVLTDPPPQVLLTGLGDSSVDFSARYWTAPQTAEATLVRSHVTAAIKTALDDGGFTIPWPIRTIVADRDRPA